MGGQPEAAVNITASDRTDWRERLLARLEAGGRYRSWVLLAALAGMFAATFPISILAVSLGTIARGPGCPLSHWCWQRCSCARPNVSESDSICSARRCEPLSRAPTSKGRNKSAAPVVYLG